MFRWQTIDFNYYVYVHQDSKINRRKRELFHKFVETYRLTKQASFPYPMRTWMFYSGGHPFNNAKKPDFDTLRNDTFVDHPLVFKADGVKGRIAVFQPYQYDAVALDNYAERFGLAYRVFPKSESFYYPGRTYLIVVSTPEVFEALNIDR